MIAPATCWITEGWGVGYEIDGLGELCGHTVERRWPGGGVTVEVRFPGKHTFQAARDEARRRSKGSR